MSLIVIEGLDGAGKSTQVGLLTRWLEENKKPYKYLHFPRLENSLFGDLVARFLRGEFGDIHTVNPYLVALIYAEDRNDAKAMLNQWLSEGNVVILDRYVYSNIAYQCAKLSNEEEKDKLKDWILNLEFNHFGLPQPTLNVFFDVPFLFTKNKLTEARTGKEREYLKGLRDIHEEDLDFQQKVREMYISFSGVSSFKRIDCSRNNTEMLGPNEIFSSLLTLVNEFHI